MVDEVAVAESAVGAPGTVNVVSVAVVDAAPVLTELIAETRYAAVSPAASVESEYVVNVEAVLATSVRNPAELRFLSIKYPVIAEPPLSAGVIHERSMLVDEVAVAESAVGAPGTVGGTLGSTVMMNVCSIA